MAPPATVPRPRKQRSAAAITRWLKTKDQISRDLSSKQHLYLDANVAPPVTISRPCKQRSTAAITRWLKKKDQIPDGDYKKVEAGFERIESLPARYKIVPDPAESLSNRRLYKTMPLRLYQLDICDLVTDNDSDKNELLMQFTYFPDKAHRAVKLHLGLLQQPAKKRKTSHSDESPQVGGADPDPTKVTLLTFPQEVRERVYEKVLIDYYKESIPCDAVADEDGNVDIQVEVTLHTDDHCNPEGLPGKAPLFAFQQVLANRQLYKELGAAIKTKIPLKYSVSKDHFNEDHFCSVSHGSARRRREEQTGLHTLRVLLPSEDLRSVQKLKLNIWSHPELANFCNHIMPGLTSLQEINIYMPCRPTSDEDGYLETVYPSEDCNNVPDPTIIFRCLQSAHHLPWIRTQPNKLVRTLIRQLFPGNPPKSIKFQVELEIGWIKTQYWDDVGKILQKWGHLAVSVHPTSI